MQYNVKYRHFLPAQFDARTASDENGENTDQAQDDCRRFDDRIFVFLYRRIRVDHTSGDIFHDSIVRRLRVFRFRRVVGGFAES